MTSRSANLSTPRASFVHFSPEVYSKMTVLTVKPGTSGKNKGKCARGVWDIVLVWEEGVV